MKKFVRIFFASFMFCTGLGLSGFATPAAAANKLSAIRTGLQPGDITRIVIETSARPSYKITFPKSATGAPQIMIALSNTSGTVKPDTVSGTLVSNITTTPAGADINIVATLKSDITKPTTMVLNPNGDAGYRLVLDIKRGTMVTDTPQPSAPKASAPAVTTTLDAPKKQRLIVLDPGHGGKDPGCISPSGTREKDIVLAIGKKLRAKLQSMGYRVIMTRDTDVFLNLGTRADIGEKNHADLFISIHENSNPNKNTHGFSVYTLSDKASDAEAQKLADAENAADRIGVDGFAKFEPDVRNILSDLQQHAVAESSLEMSAKVVNAMKSGGVPAIEKPARSAAFAVLKSTTPSVLIETGHLSNRSEEKQLKSAAYQEKLATAIAGAVDNYDFDL